VCFMYGMSGIWHVKKIYNLNQFVGSGGWWFHVRRKFPTLPIIFNFSCVWRMSRLFYVTYSLQSLLMSNFFLRVVVGGRLQGRISPSLSIIYSISCNNLSFHPLANPSATYLLSLFMTCSRHEHS